MVAKIIPSTNAPSISMLWQPQQNGLNNRNLFPPLSPGCWKHKIKVPSVLVCGEVSLPAIYSLCSHPSSPLCVHGGGEGKGGRKKEGEGEREGEGEGEGERSVCLVFLLGYQSYQIRAALLESQLTLITHPKGPISTHNQIRS